MSEIRSRFIYDAIFALNADAKWSQQAEDGSYFVYDKDNKKLSIDMSAVNTKAAELQKTTDEAEAKLKTDKLSAYKKLSMTDDEIKAIDPTLLS